MAVPLGEPSRKEERESLTSSGMDKASAHSDSPRLSTSEEAEDLPNDTNYSFLIWGYIQKLWYILFDSNVNIVHVINQRIIAEPMEAAPNPFPSII